jgi:predicted RNase H-like HicB family nuclease
VVERGATNYGITFPDFRGCVSIGDSIERGHEALAAHIELMLEDRDPIPEPSPLEAALPDWLEVGEVALRTLVRIDLPGRAVRLSITMNEALARAVDRGAPPPAASPAQDSWPKPRGDSSVSPSSHGVLAAITMLLSASRR